MEIGSHTPQSALAQLYTAVARREMLQGTPLNFRLFLRYAVLFVLFPGMIGGFWVGLAAALIFCAVLAVLLMSGMSAEAVLAVRLWLSVGALVFGYVCWSTVRAALALYRTRQMARPADAPLGAQADSPSERPLRWHRDTSGESWYAELEWDAPRPGIYALLVRVQGMGKRRLLTQGRRGLCVVRSSVSGGDLQTLVLCKLEQGRHLLRWSLHPAQGAAPAASVHLLARPE